MIGTAKQAWMIVEPLMPSGKWFSVSELAAITDRSRTTLHALMYARTHNLVEEETRKYILHGKTRRQSVYRKKTI